MKKKKREVFTEGAGYISSELEDSLNELLGINKYDKRKRFTDGGIPYQG